jgi:hypothetical protein
MMREFPPILSGLIDAVNPHVRSMVRVMNGQQSRQSWFTDIAHAFPPDAIVETGTYLGGTTEYLASLAKVPVISIESQARFYWRVRWTTLLNRRIRLMHGDSRAALRELAADPAFTRKAVLFYLDAHCSNLPGADKDDPLPLREELDLVLSHWTDAVIVIDDFEVPDDQGYGFDDYGEKGALRLDLIADLVRSKSFFYPAVSAIEETGAKRGALVIASGAKASSALRRLPTLRIAAVGEEQVAGS